jgi:hypothetical protein
LSAKEALAAVSQFWLDGENPFRCRAVTALSLSTGMSSRLVERAMMSAFEAIHRGALDSLENEIAVNGCRLEGGVILVAPSNVFTAWVPSAVTILLMGGNLWLKPSHRERIFPAVWRESLLQVDPQLSDRVRLVQWEPETVRHATACVAYGSDETLRRLQLDLSDEQSFVGYGQQLSVAVITRQALVGDSISSMLEALRMDGELFQLRGCLSPQILFSDGDLRPLSLEVATWPVVPSIKSFKTPADLLGQLGAFGGRLSCVGWAGDPLLRERVSKALLKTQPVRICALGEMQRPPLSWRNGGLFLPSELVRGRLAMPKPNA